MTRCATMRPSGRVMLAALALSAALLVLAGAARAEQAETIADASLAPLNAYVEEALANSPNLKASEAAWKAAAQRAPQVSAPPDPRFTYGYYIQPAETRTGPQRMRYAISQTIPWFGRLSNMEKQAVLEADAALARLESQRLLTAAQVRDAYYEYAYVAQAVRLTRENVLLLGYLERVAEDRYRAGLSPYAELVRLQLESGRLEDTLRSLKDLERPVRARLNTAMNRAPDSPLPEPETIPVMVLEHDEAELLAGLAECNPELRALSSLTEAAQTGMDQAKLGYFPDITLGLEMIQQDRARAGDPVNNGKYPTVATVGINLPIWFGARNAAVEEADHKRQSSREQWFATHNRLQAAMELALYRYRDAGRKIDLYQESLLPKAEQGLGATLTAYTAGQGSALDLVDAQRTLLEFQLSALRALADQGQRMAEMETLLGREIPCRVHGVRLEMNGAAQTPTQ
ncbi:outer membrane efflux protein [Alkalidesulfovibrio alkalitolerans DSM 16529]|uniref:Outer membrane efflux protein n=1 Tax=Alkalidesulfovibrio alkalitolerans DSM 16529 TaxID=1121439 RepID=S7T771_9BACT|nr:TolC family protein [Alkalidesulfovibrio alkalitolerans]EPR32426.1 outer membrane efflux protein [Alkalidesulfovibrio alkalitolerans DSM 16529]